MVSLTRVFIATTEGPSEIQRIAEDDPDVKSVICLNGTAEALPVSLDYHSFVRKPTGVVERLFGCPTYRVDVSRRISNGQSWQLGLLLAHGLHAQGRLAPKDGPADEVYWVTGEVRHNLDVMPVDHVREKLRQSESLFDGLAHLHTKVTVLVPDGNFVEAEAEIRALGLDVNLESVRCWDDFGPSAQDSDTPAPRKKPWRRVIIGVLALLLPFSAAAVLGPWWKADVPKAISVPLQPTLHSAPVAAPPTLTPPPPAAEPPKDSEPIPLPSPAVHAPPAAVPEPPPPPRSAPAAPPLVVSAVERRAPPGSGCGRLRLTGASTVDSEITASTDGFDTRSATGLCEVEFRVTNPSTERRFVSIAVDTTIEGAAPLSASETVPPGGSISLTVSPKVWDGAKSWKASLTVSDALGQRTGGEPPTSPIKPKTLTYIADAPVEPRFR